VLRHLRWLGPGGVGRRAGNGRGSARGCDDTAADPEPARGYDDTAADPEPARGYDDTAADPDPARGYDDTAADPDPARGTTTPPPTPTPPGGETKNGDAFPFPPGLAAAIALVVAGLAAVGVSGDTLTRAVRNEPEEITKWIIVALSAAAALVGVSLAEKRWNAWWKHPSPPPRRWPLIGVVVVGLLAVLGVGLVATIVFASAKAMETGANQLTDREQPLVSLQAATDEQRLTTVTIDVRATGLPTTDQMLVQVVGMTEFSDVVDEAKIRLCERNWLSDETIDEYVAEVDNTEADPGPADLLSWSRIGPDQSGAVESTIKVQFPAGTYQGVCAWGPLPVKEVVAGENPGESARNSAAYLRLGPDVTES
jgi:hypothetical protein